MIIKLLLSVLLLLFRFVETSVVETRQKMSSFFGAEPRGKSHDSLLLGLVVAVDVSLAIAALAACKFHTKI